MMDNDIRKDSGEETHFGYSSVRLGDKQALVDDVFHKVAERYDVMNDFMSFGLHRAWKDALVSSLRPNKTKPFALLDVAGGTGDVAFRVMEAAGLRGRATVCDINGDMLRVGRDRTPKALINQIEFVQGSRKMESCNGKVSFPPSRPTSGPTSRSTTRRSLPTAAG